MALDTTTGGDAAEAYASVDYADAYHEARGNASWAALSPERKEQCLRLAAEYMAGAYWSSWQGCRVTTTQRLDWPRSGVVAHEVAVSPLNVPPAVMDTNASLALKA